MSALLWVVPRADFMAEMAEIFLYVPDLPT